MHLPSLSLVVIPLAMVHCVTAGFTIYHAIWLGIDGNPFDQYLASRRPCDQNCNALLNTGVQTVTNPQFPPGNSDELKEMNIDNLCAGPALHLIRNGGGANVYRRDTNQQVGWCTPSTAPDVPCFGLGATSFYSVWDCDSYICQC